MPPSRKIKDIKQYTVDEGKKVNDSLKRYQKRYDEQLQELDQELEDKFNTEEDYQQSEYTRGYDRMQALEDMLAKERDDRISSLNDQLAPICAQMDKNFADLEAEKNARVQKEREILSNLEEESAKIEEAINNEKEERLDQQGDLMNKLGTELQRQRDKIAQIKTDTLGEFEKDKRDIYKEMDNRQEHQDRTIKNISHFISTFQLTLKAVGGKDTGATSAMEDDGSAASQTNAADHTSNANAASQSM